MQIAKAMLKNLGEAKKTKVALIKEPSSPTKKAKIIKSGPSIDAIVGQNKKVKKNKDMPRQITMSPKAAMAKKKKIKIQKIESSGTIEPPTIDNSAYNSNKDQDRSLQLENDYLKQQVESLKKMVEQERLSIVQKKTMDEQYKHYIYVQQSPMSL